MARTKQTARKGTDGAAKRTVKAGGPPIAKKAPRKLHSWTLQKEKYRYCPGTVALREICRYQKEHGISDQKTPLPETGV